MNHPTAVVGILLTVTACGLDPVYESGPDTLDPFGEAIKGNVYGIELSQVRVMYPPELQQLFQRANASDLLIGVPEQGVSTFRSFVAASDPQGEQDVCASTTELALAKWNGPGSFVIEGGRFFVPIGGTEVRFDSTNIEATIVDGNWDPMTTRALVDTRELTTVFEEGADPCGQTPELCSSCEDGLRLCMEVDMTMTAWLLDMDFDPRPSCP